VPAEDLAVAGVDGEQHADDAAVAAGDLEMVRTPADVRAERHDGAIVGLAGPAGGMGLQDEAGGAEDAEHALAVGHRLAAGATLAIEQDREAPIAVGRALVDEPVQGGQELGVAGLAVGLPGPTLPRAASTRLGRATPSVSVTAFIGNPPRPTSSTARALFLAEPARGPL
jgi:hypothetical protein